jgi:hypothetical protein
MQEAGFPGSSLTGANPFRDQSGADTAGLPEAGFLPVRRLAGLPGAPAEVSQCRKFVSANP